MPGFLPVERPRIEVLAPVAQGGSLPLGQDLLLDPPWDEVPALIHRPQDHPPVALPGPGVHQRRPPTPAQAVSVDQGGVPDSDSVRMRVPRPKQFLLLNHPLYIVYKSVSVCEIFVRNLLMDNRLIL